MNVSMDRDEFEIWSIEWILLLGGFEKQIELNQGFQCTKLHRVSVHHFNSYIYPRYFCLPDLVI